MSSPKDKEWKNPKDIMKTLKIQSSSKRLSRSQSLNLSRRMSYPQIKENLPSQSQEGRDNLKRRNPFICEQPTAKQRRSLSQGLSFDSPKDEDQKFTFTDFFKDDAQNTEKEEIQEVVESIDRSLKSVQDRLSKKKLQELKGKTNTIDLDSSQMHVSQEQVTDISKKFYSKPALDWSLKTKMRVVTTCLKSNGSSTIPGIDAKHLNAFIHGKYEQDDWQDLDVFHKIRRCCFHYAYPRLPWLSTFPRLKAYYKAKSSYLDTSNANLLESLQRDWARVFLSVYQQLRGGLCPYFYLCTHQFTVLFRCLRSQSRCFLSALLSPTTRGLRELLEKEGISFQMPNLKMEKRSKSAGERADNENKESARKNKGGESSFNTDTQEINYESSEEDLFDDNNDDDDDDKDKGPSSAQTKAKDDCAGRKSKSTEEDSKSDDNNDVVANDDDTNDDDTDCQAVDWLEAIGLDKKDFPTLRPHNVKLQRENYQDIDHRSQSLVYVDGLDVHALFNFLLCFPACIASSGPQYGLPPSIISPCPFDGATLVSNSVKQSVVQSSQVRHEMGLTTPTASGDTTSSSSGSHDSCHVIEISGPILPHHTVNISAILNRSGSGAKVSYSLHQPSTAFNTGQPRPHTSDITNTGLSKLLAPFSQDRAGLMAGGEDVLLSDTDLSAREVSVSPQGFSYS